MTRRTPANPFAGRDVRWLLDAQAHRHGDKTCLIWAAFDRDPVTWTYREFVTAIRRFAAGLHARGVAPGDRIIVHIENCPEFLIAWLGCAYAGAVAVTTNARSTAAELAYFAAHSEAVGAITQPGIAEIVAQAMGGRGWLCVTANAEKSISAAIPPSALAFVDIDADPGTLSERAADPMAPFGIQYTSGTTARPKAVLWSHVNFLWRARQSAAHEGLTAADVHLVTMPLFHTNAQIYSVAASLWVGATIVLQPRFSASRFWPISLAHGCTWASVVPFCVKALAAHPVPSDHRNRHFGNAICDPASDAHFWVKTVGWWGMTETVTHGVVGSPHHPDTSMSMGRPAAGYDIHVLDTDMRPVAPGETGDLYVGGIRGVSLFVEYAGDPAATAAAFTADGLFITGDRVRIGLDGALFFGDRAKDMLKVGGEKVAASEVERVIARVAGVREVAVVGRRDPMLGEVPVAFIIAAVEGDVGLAARIVDACARELADFKQPREVRIVDTLPRATLEKVAKAQLRAQVKSEGEGV
jgi:carnitine-CoA ligase